MSDHTSKNFDLELESLRTRVLQMGGMVEQQVRKAIEGLYSGDQPLLENVIRDDDPVNQLLMQKQLGALGCRWVGADNSRTALEELARTPFDLVLMDLHMPDVDGLTAIKQIRAGQAGVARKDVWIAALTADARIGLKEEALAIGANDFLIKPLGLPELRIALEKLAMARRTGGAGPA